MLEPLGKHQMGDEISSQSPSKLCLTIENPQHCRLPAISSWWHFIFFKGKLGIPLADWDRLWVGILQLRGFREGSVIGPILIWGLSSTIAKQWPMVLWILSPTPMWPKASPSHFWPTGTRKKVEVDTEDAAQGVPVHRERRLTNRGPLLKLRRRIPPPVSPPPLSHGAFFPVSPRQICGLQIFSLHRTQCK